MVNTKLLLKYHPDLKIILVAVLYYISARLGYFLAFHDSTALPTWPPSGIAFALLILLGRSTWPGITIGALVANLMAYWNNATLPTQTIITVSCFIAVGHTVEAVIGNFLIKKWIKDDYPFKHARNAFRFLFVTLFMCAVGAGIGSVSLWANGVIWFKDCLKTGFSWWVCNIVGILLFTPFILACVRWHKFNFNTGKFVEIGIFISSIVGIFLLLQLDYLGETMERALPFLCLPFLLWLAFRFDLLVAISGVVITSLFSIYITVKQTGPFVLSYSDHSMILLQIFIGVVSISTIILSATVHERLTVQHELESFNLNLENIIQERTKELNDEVRTRREAEEKLQRTNQELSKRNSELDNFVYSVSHDLRAPIASVLGLINLARKDKDNTMKQTYLEMINNSALQQDHFIKEILDQSRNSRLEVRREEIFFEPLIDETFNHLKFATSNDKTVEKVISIDQDKPFFSDSWRLKVILNNIISNSIRYRNGKDPVIRVNVKVNDRKAKLSIEDNGKGIAREHIGNVCKMFYRATDDGAGSGLGLYIVKEAIDKLNGSIKIDSQEGRGTIVMLEIPAL